MHPALPRLARLCVTTLSLAVCVAGTVLPAPARAQIAFDNFGPGDTFNLIQGWNEGGPTSFIGYASTGEGFTPAVSGQLSSITIALSHAARTNDAHLFLSDATSGTPGTILESWTLSNMPFFGTNYVPEVVNSVLHPQLSVGTLYFLYTDEPGDEKNVWNWNSTGGQGPHIVSDGGPYVTTTDVQGAFRVVVRAAAVPEPSTCIFLAGLVIPGVMLLRRRRA